MQSNVPKEETFDVKSIARPNTVAFKGLIETSEADADARAAASRQAFPLDQGAQGGKKSSYDVGSLFTDTSAVGTIHGILSIGLVTQNDS